MTLSQRAVEAAARAAYHATPRNKPYDVLTLHKKNLYRSEAEAAITAALAVDGLCLVQTPASCLSWPPFNVGDRVTHLSRQENGTVTAIEDGCVVVEFDRPTPKGQKSVGKYDAAWFRMYPRGLIAAANDGEERSPPPDGTEG